MGENRIHYFNAAEETPLPISFFKERNNTWTKLFQVKNSKELPH